MKLILKISMSLYASLLVTNSYNMVPGLRLALKELQKASYLKIKNNPILAFVRSKHTTIQPIISAPKNNKPALPFFLAALGSTALLTDSKQDNQFFQNTSAIAQDIPFYTDFLETYITTSIANQSIGKLYEFVKNHSKKLPVDEQKKMFYLFIKQWCHDKLQPALKHGRPFSEIEKTLIQPLKNALEKIPQSERYGHIETVIDGIIATMDEDDTKPSQLFSSFFNLVTPSERVLLSLALLDHQKSLEWQNFFADVQTLSSDQNTLATQAEKTFLNYLEKMVAEVETPKKITFARFILECLPILPDRIKRYVLTNGSPQTLTTLYLLNNKLFSKEEYQLLLTNYPQQMLNTVKNIGFTADKGEFENAISNLIVHESDSELFRKLFSRHVIQLSAKNKDEWISRFEEENYNALTQTKTSESPLFSYIQRYRRALFLAHSVGNENFYNLLPDIVDYVEKQYTQKKIVLFHGNSSEWIFLEALYRRLYEQKNNIKIDPNYRFLRFTDHSALSEKEIATIKTAGVSYRYDNHLSEKPATILFTNLHPFINDAGANSWLFALDNRDFAGTGRIDQMLPTIFNNLNMTHEYEQFQKKYPEAIKELKELFDNAIKEQGGYGQLLVISLPENLAERLTYSTDPEGRPQQHLSNNQELTTSTVTLAKKSYDMPTKHQHVLILNQQILNPKAAQKNEVEIKSFDPTAYWRTEKYRTFEKKLDEVVELIETLKI